MNVFKAISNTNKQIDKYFKKGLLYFWGFIILMIIYTLINADKDLVKDRPDQPKEISQEIKYTNCETSSENEFLDQSPLKTNINKSDVSIIKDTQPSGVEKNEIPAIQNPKFIDINIAKKCIDNNEQVLVLKLGDFVKIYPKSILQSHQAINDNIASDLSEDNQVTNILIAYSPFSDSFSAYLRNNDLFFVSGRLKNGNTLLFDQKTESLWLELNGEAIIGDRTGEKLEVLPFFLSDFQHASLKYPDALVLSFDTGYKFDYSSKIYDAYWQNNQIIGDFDENLYSIDAKEKVLGIEYKNIQKAYLLENIQESDINDSIDDLDYVIKKDESLGSIIVSRYNTSQDMQSIPFKITYFYTWQSVYPETIYY